MLSQLAKKYGIDTTKPSPLSLHIPADSLLHLEQSELLQQTLSQDALRTIGIFDPQVVEELLQQEQVSRELLLVFTTQLLCQLFGTGM